MKARLSLPLARPRPCNARVQAGSEMERDNDTFAVQQSDCRVPGLPVDGAGEPSICISGTKRRVGFRRGCRSAACRRAKPTQCRASPSRAAARQQAGGNGGGSVRRHVGCDRLAACRSRNCSSKAAARSRHFDQDRRGSGSGCGSGNSRGPVAFQPQPAALALRRIAESICRQLYIPR